MDAALGVRVLENDASDVLSAEVHVVDIHNLDLDSKGPCSCHHTADGLGVQLVREKESESRKCIEYLLRFIQDLTKIRRISISCIYLFLLLTL